MLGFWARIGYLVAALAMMPVPLVLAALPDVSLPELKNPVPLDAAALPIIHDAEHYILYAQNGEVWAAQDQQIDQVLAQSRQRHGRPPNLIHLMWDDQPFGAVGIPAMQPMRGYSTPHLNRLAAEGILFTRLYSELASTPARSASLTGQLAVRNGLYQLGYPIAYRGISSDNVTLAEVLDQAGYATGFFGKLHLGDIEQTYPHNQGFHESFFALYDSPVPLWHELGRKINYRPVLQGELGGHRLDHSFIREGFVFYLEGSEGGETREWCGTSKACFGNFDRQAHQRLLDFVGRNAQRGKPFYAAWWPLRRALAPTGQGVVETYLGEEPGFTLDEAVGKLIAALEALEIDENTVIVAMSANGPGHYQSAVGERRRLGPFRGGKGDFLEGGVRVSAQVWWPGMIAPNQIVDDMVHVTDWYTTFARLAGASEYIPRDRIVDGLDQTALLLYGSGYSRRDYNFIYKGPLLAAAVKRNYKVHWVREPGRRREMDNRAFDLLRDHREVKPVVLGGFQFKEPFRRMRARHEQWIERYPHRPAAKGPAYTGIVNARPKTRELSNGDRQFENLPFDPLNYIEHELP